MKPANAKRRARLHREQFVGPIPGYDHANAIRKMPCCVTQALPPSVPHHVKSRGAGGKWTDLVPLCHEAHLNVHAIGRWTFQEKYGVDLEVIADQLASGALDSNGAKR